MSPRYRVTLTEQERNELEALTKKGKTHARRFIHARALLLCDAGEFGSPWSVADTAEALGVSSRTIEHLKKRFVEEGLEAALERKPRENPPREVRLDGEFEASAYRRTWLTIVPIRCAVSTLKSDKTYTLRFINSNFC